MGVDYIKKLFTVKRKRVVKITKTEVVKAQKGLKGYGYICY